MAVAKVTLNSDVIVDMTDATATESEILDSETAYIADGSKAIGTARSGGSGASEWKSLVSPTTPSTSVKSYSQSFGDYKELFCAYNITATDGSTNISTQLGIGTKTARVANNIKEYAGYSSYKRFIVFVHAVKTDDNNVAYSFITLRGTSSNTGITTNNMTLPSYDYYAMGVVAIESDLIAFYDNNTTDTNKTYTFAAWGR